MFPASKGFNVTAVSAVLMVLMMMMMLTGAAPKHHRKLLDASEKNVSLLLDPDLLTPSRNVRPLKNISISPWTYNTSSDDSLFPPVISEAHCLLQGCLDLAGKEDLNLRSRPIMHQMLVLRRVKSHGQDYHYRLETRLIAVGCTCVRHVVHVQE